VFVSSSLGSNDNPGTRAHPVQSIEKAIALAQGGPMRVYACAEAFVEAVVLPSGVELWGGLDCTNDWTFIGADKKTILAPEPDEVPLRVTAGGGSSKVADVRAEAADALEASGSSMAVMIMPDAAVEILRSELVAGDGAPGAPGEDGGVVPAQAGAPGDDGGAACSEIVVSGGSAVVTACGDLESIGGQGGDGHVASGTDGLDGQPEPEPNPFGHGLGGVGATTGSCMSGGSGESGADGAQGAGATGAGRISISGWEGENGKDGGSGLPGQGGGA